METTYQAASANPVACLVLLAMGLITLLGSSRNAVKALLFTSAIIPMGQMFVIGNLHLHFFRILILVGVFRLMVRREARDFHWNIVDKLTIWWTSAALVCAVFRGLDGESVGFVFTALGSYFLVRCLCKGPEDFLEYVRFLALLMFGIALSMCVESVTRHNPFAIFGGVNAVPILREGRPRCQGPFRIFLLAGSFAATLLPLMVGLWLQGRQHRFRAALGIIGSILGTYLCNSSGPLMCLFSAILGFALWPLRFRMRTFRRCVMLIIVALALYMKAPVWYLISKAGDIFGGSSWHRSYLIDQFFQHFTQWALVGTSYTANWAPAGEVLASDPNNMDITNNYITQGVRGGVWQFFLFLAIIVCCYKIIGRLVRGSSDGIMAPKMIWAIGVALTGHCVAFIDISYFDQSAVFWCWLTAVIAGFSIFAIHGPGQVVAPVGEHPTSGLEEEAARKPAEFEAMN